MIRLLMRFFRRGGQAFRQQWLVPLLFFVALFAYSTTGYMYFEVRAKPDLSWTDAAWWSVVTMTTVGYGDYFPESDAGRLLVGVPTMLLGVSMLGYLLSLLASGIMESRLKEIQGMAAITCSDHIIICHYHGLGPTLKLIEELQSDPSTADAPLVLIAQALSEIPEDLRQRHVLFVAGDPSRESVLEQANFREARLVLIQVDAEDTDHSDNRNLAIALTIERLCPEVFTVVHCQDPERAVFFERANCDSVVCPNALTSQVIVQELQDPGVFSVLGELTSNTEGKQFYIVEAPKGAQRVADLRAASAAHRAVLVGVRRGCDNLLLPDEDMPLQAGDRAILIAPERPASL